MKPLDEMSNDELAELVEYVSNYQTNDRYARKLSVDLKMVIPVLRGYTELPEGFQLFSRAEANDLLPGSGFMLALYGQLIDRLQPPQADLTEGELAVLESISETGLIHRDLYADGGDLGREQKRVIRKLYDIGLIENAEYNPLGMKTTAFGVRFLKINKQTEKSQSSPQP